MDYFYSKQYKILSLNVEPITTLLLNLYSYYSI